MPDVSVIIPNYNHADFLHKRLQSVLNQTYSSYEIIILDDNSTDNSRAIIEEYRHLDKVSHIIFNEHNGGAFSQWKKGIELAKGEYIWIAESDDFAEKDFLESLMASFEQDKDVTLSYCRSRLINEKDEDLGLHLWMDKLDNEKWTRNYIEDGQYEVKRFLKFRNTICNASSVVFKKIKGVEELIPTDMEYCGDWLFWKRLLKNQGKVAYIPSPLSFFRDHDQTSRAIATQEKELKRFKEYRTFIDLTARVFFESRYDWMLREWMDRKYLFRDESHQFNWALRIRYLFLFIIWYFFNRMRRWARRLPKDSFLSRRIDSLKGK